MAVAPTIDEVRLPDDISRGAVGGPTFATIVTVLASGGEQRTRQWSVARHKWVVGFDARSPTTGRTLLDFFFNRYGRSNGFRFKDWNDFSVTNEPLVITGSKLYQLTKTYTSLGNYVREIYKIVSSPAVTLRRNGGSFTTFTLDVNTGIVTITTPDVTRNITNITQANPAVITTSVAHGYAVGDKLWVEGVVGMTQMNNRVITAVSPTSGTTITTDVDSTLFSPYVSGGVVNKYIQPSETFDWTGEFDVPVRFDTDEFMLEQEEVTVRSWHEIPIIELRGT